MERRGKVLVALALAGALAAGAYALRHDPALDRGASDGGVALAPGTARLRFDWPRGSAYTYGIEWHGETVASVPVAAAERAQTVGGTSDLAGDLVVRSYGIVGPSYALSMSLEHLERQSFVIEGKPVFASLEEARAQLTGRAVVADVNERGEILALHFEREAPVVFKQVMRALLLELAVSFSETAAASWTSTELGPLGTARARYERDAKEPSKVTRTRLDYVEITHLPPGPAGTEDAQHLEGTTDLELDPRGHLKALDDRSSLVVSRGGAPALTSRSSFALAVKEVSTFAAGDPPAGLDSMRPDEDIDNPLAGRELLEQETKGLTLERLTEDLGTLGRVGSLPEQQRWFARAVALLTLHPGMCDALVKAFGAPDTNPRSRPFLLNILAVVGHAGAQAALVEALKLPAAHQPPGDYVKLLQYLSMVEKPDAATAAFVRAAYDAAGHAGALRNANAFVLGSMAHGLGRTDPELATAYNARLRRDLKDARTREDRVALLAALGNARRTENVAVFAENAHDADAEVRRQVATSLRNADTTEGRALLVEMAADPESAVASSAFHAMDSVKLDVTDLESLARLVVSGRTPLAADSSLVAFLRSHLDGGAPVRTILGYLLARNEAQRELHAQIDMLLSQMP